MVTSLNIKSRLLNIFVAFALVFNIVYPSLTIQANAFNFNFNWLPNPTPTVIVDNCVEGPTWAYGVESTAQGLRKNGTAVLAARSDSNNALGAPNVQFFSLGQSGVIELGFQYPVTNVAGDDLSFHEITNGVYPEEKADVEVSQDGITWFAIGSVTNTSPGGVSYLDFNGSGLAWIKFVKITDTTEFSLHTAEADGYDLDAVDATNGLCDDYPEPEVNICEVDYSVNNTEDLSTIDTSTGTKTTIGTLSFGSSAAAIDSVNERIYYVERYDNNDNKILAYYDLNTNTNTTVGSTGSTKIIDKLAFDSNGTLYGMAASKELYTIDTATGVATLLATLNVQGGGGDLAFDETGDLYVILLNGNFYKINIGTLTTTFIGDTNIAATGLIYKSDGYFYAGTETQLYKFDIAGVASPTFVGTDSEPKSNDLTNCAIKPEGGTGIISGRKYKDVNKNGVFDQEEQEAPGNLNRLDGWKIKLFDDEWTKLASMETGDDTTSAGNVGKGQYKFVDLPAGTYFVCEENRADEGWVQSQPTEVTFEMHHGLYCYTVVLEAGENVDGLRFGNYKRHKPYISGYKWNDENKDGVWDEGEEGIKNWKIVVKSQAQEPIEQFDVYADDQLGVTTTTVFDDNKYYLVEVEGTWTNSGDQGVVDAEYYTHDDWGSHVDFGQTPGWTPPMLDLLVNNKEIDWGTYNAEHLYKKVLKGKDTTANFRVFDEDISNPANNDAWYNDNGGSLKVRIYEVETLLKTDEDGYYGAKVDPGEYQIIEVNSKGWVQTAPDGPSYCHVDVDFDEKAECDFGNHRKPKDEEPTPTPSPSEDPSPSVTPTGTNISGYKWEDKNGDGQRGEGEDGVEGWEVTLYRYLQNVQVDSADDNGIDVPLGNDNYYLEIAGDFNYSTSQTGWRSDAEWGTFDDYLTLRPSAPRLFIDDTDPDLGVFNLLHNYDHFINVSTNTVNFKIFDDVYTDNEGFLSINVWEEISVTLTGADGTYLFGDLEPGDYFVKEVYRTGWTQTFPGNQFFCWVEDLAADAGEICNFGNQQDEVITPTPTPTPSPTGTYISGYKWEDGDGDGQKGEGEDGVENWGITLYKELTGIQVDSTDVDGETVPLVNDDYLFQISGDFTYDNSDAINNRADAEYSTSNAYVTPNLDDILLIDSFDPVLGDFDPLHKYEYLKTVSTGSVNFLIFDSDYTDNSGSLFVKIWQEFGVTNTASDGTYFFDNLEPGSYMVQEEQKDGWTQTFPGEDGVCLFIELGQDVGGTCNFGNRQDEIITPTPTPTEGPSEDPTDNNNPNLQRNRGGSGGQNGNGTDEASILGESTSAPIGEQEDLTITPIVTEEGSVKAMLVSTGKNLSVPMLIGILNLSLLTASTILIRRKTQKV